MHQLAIALQSMGHTVTGSDDEIEDPAKSNLAAAGILPPQTGWFPEKITNRLDAIVLGMHAKADNPELLAAQKWGLPIMSFPEYIYEVSKHKTRVVVAGSHGKTTVTSMIMHILKHNGIDFDYMVGAKVAGFEGSVRLSDAPLIILEGDEYPASAIEKKPKILFYHPNITVITGIAWDHINVFPTYDNYFSQFTGYLHGLEPQTRVVYNEEDAEVRRAVASTSEDIVKIAYQTPQWEYADGAFAIVTGIGKFPVSVFGRHNMQNIAAAMKACTELGIHWTKSLEAIASFTGAAKRLEQLYETPTLKVFRDFAHAPSKLKATLDAVREAFPEHFLLACFELHTYSSLNKDFMAQYSGSMDKADRAIVFYSHHALEIKGLPDVAAADVAAGFGNPGLTVTTESIQLVDYVTSAIRESGRPTFLLLMTSGTFGGIDWKNVCSHI